MTMNTSHPRQSGNPGATVRGGRDGMTLLEVLVALGILVAGLASVASLMPAAGARLADAAAIDRAGTLSANALADLRNRNRLTAATLFPANNIKIAFLGKLAALDGTVPTPFNTAPYAMYPAVIPAAEYLGQDDVRLESADKFVVNDAGVCYGATVVPADPSLPVAAGSRGRVSIVVFKKPPVEASALLALTKVSGGLFRLTNTGTAGDALRKKFFPACSWCLARDLGNLNRVQWLHIGSSWTTQTYVGGTLVSGSSFVSFSDATSPIITSATTSMVVHGFTRVLRVDEQPVILK